MGGSLKFEVFIYIYVYHSHTCMRTHTHTHPQAFHWLPHIIENDGVVYRPLHGEQEGHRNKVDVHLKEKQCLLLLYSVYIIFNLSSHYLGSAGKKHRKDDGKSVWF